MEHSNNTSMICKFIQENDRYYYYFTLLIPLNTYM